MAEDEEDNGALIAFVITVIVLTMLFCAAAVIYKYKKKVGQKIEQKSPELVAALPESHHEPNASNADLLNNEESRPNDVSRESAHDIEFHGNRIEEASAEFTGDEDDQGASSSD